MANQSSSPASLIVSAAATTISNFTRGSNSTGGGYGLDAAWDAHQQRQGVGDSAAADNEAGGDGSTTGVEHLVSIVVAICFGLIGLAGLLGNSLVILGTWLAGCLLSSVANRVVILCVVAVIAVNPSMRSTTNLLINSLAVADILFVLFCVPFTASDYVLPAWPFGNAWCKVVGGEGGRGSPKGRKIHFSTSVFLSLPCPGPVHDRGDVPRECLHAGPDVPRPLPGRRPSHHEHVGAHGAKRFHVSQFC